MLIGSRNAMMAGNRLPYDAEVEYILCTGTQYIDTGFFPNQDTSVSIDFQLTDITTSGAETVGNLIYLVDAKQDWSTRAYTIGPWAADNTNKIATAYGNSGGVPPTYNLAVPYTTTRMTAVFNKNFVSVGNLWSYTFSYHNFNCPNNLRIFSSTNEAQARQRTKGYIFGAQVYNDGTLVRDFIPVRFTNELGQAEGAMYDKVTKQLFRNAGTGAFVIGPDIVGRGGGRVSANV